MCSARFSVHGLKNEVYSCVACLFRFMDKRTRYINVHVARLFRFMD